MDIIWPNHEAQLLNSTETLKKACEGKEGLCPLNKIIMLWVAFDLRQRDTNKHLARTSDPWFRNALKTVNKLPHLMKMEEVTLHPLMIDFLNFHFCFTSQIVVTFKTFSRIPWKFHRVYHSSICLWHQGGVFNSPFDNFCSVFLDISTSTSSELFLQLHSLLFL